MWANFIGNEIKWEIMKFNSILKYDMLDLFKKKKSSLFSCFDQSMSEILKLAFDYILNA